MVDTKAAFSLGLHLRLLLRRTPRLVVVQISTSCPQDLMELLLPFY